MKKGLLILLNLFVAAQFCLGQAILPKGFATGEEAKMPRYIESVLEDGRGDSDPPEESVRTMAEWEELDAVVVTWTSFPSILAEIVLNQGRD